MYAHAIVFTGGSGPKERLPESLIPPNSYICAADSGLDCALRMHVPVHMAIGDFDSLSQKELLQVTPHILLPKEKDITDTEAILMHLIEKKIPDYSLIGGGEGRFDHTLHLYSLFALYGPPKVWITAQETLFRVKEYFSLTLEVGTTISIIPAIPFGESRISSSGLKWNLSSYRITPCRQSISNETTAQTCSFSVIGSPVFISIPFSDKKDS